LLIVSSRVIQIIPVVYLKWFPKLTMVELNEILRPGNTVLASD